MFLSRLKPAMAAALCITAGTGAVIAPTAQAVSIPPIIVANTPAAYGFAWAQTSNPAVNTPYAAHTSYAHNSAGGTPTVTRTNTGTYRVRFPGLGADQPNGTAHAVAVNSVNRCKVQAWGATGSDLDVLVRCHTPGGSLANAQFVARYYREGTVQANQSAYLLSPAPSPAIGTAVTPSAAFSYNSRGGTNQVTRTATGVYSVSLPGFTAVGGNPQVTAFGLDNRYCKVAGWANNSVSVRCFNAAGTPADSQFTMQYTDRHVANNGRRGTHLWTNDATDTDYTPAEVYRFHSGGSANSAAITSSWTGTGRYEVTLPNLPASNDSTVAVTGYGANSSYCTVAGWAALGSSTRVSVRCYTAAGAATDSRFTLAYLTNVQV